MENKDTKLNCHNFNNWDDDRISEYYNSVYGDGFEEKLKKAGTQEAVKMTQDIAQRENILSRKSLLIEIDNPSLKEGLKKSYKENFRVQCYDDNGNIMNSICLKSLKESHQIFTQFVEDFLPSDIVDINTNKIIESYKR